jgi:hypothetical protein
MHECNIISFGTKLLVDLSPSKLLNLSAVAMLISFLKCSFIESYNKPCVLASLYEVVIGDSLSWEVGRMK